MLRPLVLWVISLTIFLLSPVSQVEDSRFTVLLSESILKHQSFYFDFERNFPSQGHGRRPVEESDYHFQEARGRVAYRYPYGSSILSLPIVGLANLFGEAAERRDGRYDDAGEERIERVIAALVCATLVVVLFQIAALWLPATASFWTALIAALGSQIWSTASRGLWSVTWECLLLSFAIYLLAAAESRDAPVSGSLLASVLSWAYFSRPTASISVAFISLFMIRRQRRSLPLFMAVGLAWLAVFLGFSRTIHAEYVPWYYRSPFLDNHFRVSAFLALLVSPSRGLFIFCPVFLVVAWLLVRYRRHLPCRGLVLLSVPIVITQLAIPAFEPGWTGGYSYGPRLFTDLVPWLFLDGVIALAGRREALRAQPRTRLRPVFRLETIALLATTLWGVFVHSQGAFSSATETWNALPVSIDTERSRVWDWADPQFLAAFTRARAR